MSNLNLLEGYAPVDAIAADLDISPRTVRRRISAPDGWPVLRMGGKDYLHVPTIRKMIEGATRQRNPRRGAK